MEHESQESNVLDIDSLRLDSRTLMRSRDLPYSSRLQAKFDGANAIVKLRTEILLRVATLLPIVHGRTARV